MFLAYIPFEGFDGNVAEISGLVQQLPKAKSEVIKDVLMLKKRGPKEIIDIGDFW